MNSTPQFDPAAYSSTRLPKAVEQERALIAHVGRAVGAVAYFSRRGRSLVLVHKASRRVIPVNRKPDSAFSKLLAAVTGLSPRLPAVQRALDVVLSEATAMIAGDTK